MLELRSVSTRYGQVQVLWDISLTVGDGELVCLLGGNASGKSTTMKTILGLVHPFAGELLWQGRPIHRATPAQIVRAGIAPVLESRRIFPDLTVHENLLMGAFTVKDKALVAQRLEKVYELFSFLKGRKNDKAGNLSGGQQKVLEIGRALMLEPPLMLLDEPSLGLAPKTMETLFETVRNLNQTGLTILMVEQNARQGLASAHRGYVLELGKEKFEGTAKELLDSPEMAKLYLGGSTDEKSYRRKKDRIGAPPPVL